MGFKCIALLLTIFAINSQCATIEQEVRNSTKFTLDWYHSSFDANKNTVVSPISFRILLSLLYESAIGDTEHELQENVYFSDKRETAVSQLLTLNNLMNNPNLKIVNRVYIKEGYQLKQSLTDRAVEYHSGFESKDFSKKQQTADEINHFVEEQTNGLIKDLISPDIFDDLSRILLLNTLYFKADWASVFNEREVQKHDFHGIDGHTHLIDFMHKESSFKLHHCSEMKAHTLKLDYVAQSKTQFIIILPDEDSNLSEVKTKLNSVTLNEILNNDERLTRKLYMPKFEIESTIDGVAELSKLGLTSMFQKEEIDALQTGPHLYVSDAKQKAKIIVNTKGTEAAAASYLLEGQRQALMVSFEKVEKLYIDRPFIYLIVTTDTQEPLFIGHYSQPPPQ